MKKLLEKRVEEILNMYYDEMYKELFGHEYSEERESLLYAVLSSMSIEEIEDFSSWLSEYFLVESYDDVYFLQKYISYRREEEK